MPEYVSSTSSGTGTSDGTGLRVAVLVARWYPEIMDRLRSAALATLSDLGVKDDDVLVVDVPGAYELPQAAGWIARAGDVDAIVALGCVIRGETSHFDLVAGGAAEGLMQVALTSGIPVGLGVITAENRDQANARSATDDSGKGVTRKPNKGVEAAEAAVRMAVTYRALEARRPS